MTQRCCLSSSSPSSTPIPVSEKDQKTERINNFANYYIKTFLALTVLAFFFGSAYCFSKSLKVIEYRQKQFLLGASALFALCGASILGAVGYEWRSHKNREGLSFTDKKNEVTSGEGTSQNTNEPKPKARKQSSATEGSPVLQQRSFEEIVASLQAMKLEDRVIQYQEVLTRWPQDSEKMAVIVGRISQDVSEWSTADVAEATKKAYANLVEKYLRTDLVAEDNRMAFCMLPLPYTVEQLIYLYSFAQTKQQRESFRSLVPQDKVFNFEEALVGQYCETMHGGNYSLQEFNRIESVFKPRVVRAWVERDGGIGAIVVSDRSLKNALYQEMNQEVFFNFINGFSLGDNNQQFTNTIQEICQNSPPWITVASLLQKSQEFPAKSDVYVFFAGVKMNHDVSTDGGRILENLIEHFPNVPQNHRNYFLNIIFTCRKIVERITEFDLLNRKMTLTIGVEKRVIENAKKYFEDDYRGRFLHRGKNN